MVVSLTIIPVLAARFLGRKPMPHSGPIYNLLAGSYEGLLRVGLRFPRSTVLLSLLALIPLWWISTHLDDPTLVDQHSPGKRVHARDG
jgi:Cu/Ag efflux pump CusA